MLLRLCKIFKQLLFRLKRLWGVNVSKLLQKVFNPLATKRVGGGGRGRVRWTLVAMFLLFFIFAKFLQAVVPGYQLAQIAAGKRPFPNRVINFFSQLSFPYLSKQL